MAEGRAVEGRAEALAAIERLVAEIETFPIRDRALKRIHERMKADVEIARHSGAPPDPHLVRDYKAALSRYFSPFRDEARRHLSSLDRRLEHLAQLQFNATAERGVAARRVEVTEAVLASLTAL